MTAVSASVFGDTIYVANGVYQEQVVMIPGLALIGAGSDSCRIDTRSFATSSSRAVQVFDSCLIKGFYVLISNTNIGYGIVALGQSGLITQNKVVQGTGGIDLWYSNATVYNNNCINNRVGIYVTNSHALVRANTSSSNYIGGADIHIEAIGYNYFPIIDSNYIKVSPGQVGIKKHIDSSPTIKNNIIMLKGGGRGIFSNVGGISKIYNNLIIADQSGYQGIDKVSQVEVINNHIIGHFSSYGILAGPNDIIKNNVVTDANSGIESSGIQNLPYLQYNNSWNNGINYVGFTPDTTNLSVDPMIVNDDTTQGELDFHLQKYSPLIDAGDPNILDKDGTEVILVFMVVLMEKVILRRFSTKTSERTYGKCYKKDFNN
jgi:parallel beta-helix repeat protein